jgi:murein L,D-transpeptidase YafK
MDPGRCLLVTRIIRWTERLAVIAATVLAASILGRADAQQSTAVAKVDRILVVKSTRTMTLFSGDKALKTYQIALGGEPVGAKEKEGDHRTPEGWYTIDSKNSKSQFHLALHVSYPNDTDRARARKLGVHPGGAIMIHGLPKEFAWMGSLHRRTDWTDGCIAVTNLEIEEIWRLVPVGTPIEIRP